MTLVKGQAVSVLKKHGRSFYFASKLLAPKYRARAARLYTFCRYIDDLADESKDLTLAGEELDQIKLDVLQGHSKQAFVADMIALMEEISIPQEPVLALIQGVQSDLWMQCIQDEAELLRYSYRVAGTVGLMMCVLLDVRSKEALPFAMDLGIAMQLTNIARDVGQDAAKGRIYLPTTWLGDITTAEISEPNISQALALQNATKQILSLASDYYRSGLAGVTYLPPAARYGIIVAAAIYSEIGQVIAQSDFRSWDRRAVVSQPRKLYCAGNALLHYLLQSRARTTPPKHDLHLHRHLQSCFGAHNPSDT